MRTPLSPEGLRHDYEQTLLTLADLSAKYKLTTQQIAAFRKTEGWTVRDSSPAALAAYTVARAVKKLERAAAADSLATAPSSPSSVSFPCVGEEQDGVSAAPPDARAIAPPVKPKRGATGGSHTHRRLMIARLYDTVDAKLAELETRIASRSRLTGTETEREVRQLGNLIKTFEKLIELSDAEPKTTRAAAVDTHRDDAERLRQSLLDRFAKLQPRPDQISAG